MASLEHKTPKVCIITGSNTGIGFNAAVKLAQDGFEVIIACRSTEKGNTAVETVEKLVPGAIVQFLQLDLASLKSVKKFAEDFHALDKPLHVLCNNAGLGNFNNVAMKTDDGFELHMGTNHLGHYLLTMLLLDDLKRTAEDEGEARLVVTTSSVHDPELPRGFGHLDFDNLMLEKENTYNGQLAYGNSKLANILFTYELARRLDGSGVTANCLCPGFIPDTEFIRHAPSFQRFMLRYPLGFLLKMKGKTSTVDDGGDNIHLLATDTGLKGVTAKYFRYLAQSESSKESYDQEVAKKLWDVSAELVGYEDAKTL